MSESTTPDFAIIDPTAGISGDMVLGALLDLGIPQEWLTGLPARLGVPDVSISVASVDRNGLRARKVTVTDPSGAVEQPSTAHGEARQGGREHHHHGPHRHVAELVGLIERAEISESVKRKAIEAFDLLARAEGTVHGVAPESVHLHEVGAFDALIDIVGAIEGFERLGVAAVYHWPLALGNGWVDAAHGTIPVPAPATALLVEGLEIGPDGPVKGEATTPTGAVLLRALSSGPPPARWRGLATGWGAGGRNPKGYANVVRIMTAQRVSEAGEVAVLSTDLDDLNPEYLEPLREALIAAGGLDVQSWSTQMKKGRPGVRIECVAPADAVPAVSRAMLDHSPAAGLRIGRYERVTLPRREVKIAAAPGFEARVKILDGPSGPRAKPEYEDVVELARRLDRPAHELALELSSRALQSLAGSGNDRPEPAKE